jgi:hypothetical protein
LQNLTEKIFYGQNVSLTEIDKVGSEDQFGCFQAASRRLLKRKHSEMEQPTENEPQSSKKKSFFAAISEKLGFSRESNDKPRSILQVQNRFLSPQRHSGEMNYSYQHDSFVTNIEKEHETPRKRVKFDEENLIVSSITYQRQQSQQRLNLIMEKDENKSQSMFSKFVDFTANLF